jgi:hypothetical protein
VKRLGASKDRFALEHCKTLLERHPEETDYVLGYLAAVEAVDDVQPHLIAYINSKEAVYPYQVYLIIEWLTAATKDPGMPLLKAVRARAFDGNLPSYLRCACRAFLAIHGSAADLERLQHAYDTASASEQADVICCLRRMEKNRRNAFIARAAEDGYWNARAARWVKSSGAYT